MMSDGVHAWGRGQSRSSLPKGGSMVSAAAPEAPGCPRKAVPGSVLLPGLRQFRRPPGPLEHRRRAKRVSPSEKVC